MIEDTKTVEPPAAGRRLEPLVGRMARILLTGVLFAIGAGIGHMFCALFGIENLGVFVGITLGATSHAALVEFDLNSR